MLTSRWRWGGPATVLVVLSSALLAGAPAGNATSGGSAYAVPAAVDSDPSPDVLETTLVADEATVEVGGGRTAKVQAFNGAIPGPTLRLKVGDTVVVHYENKLATPSAVHWHGIELANAMDGTGFTQDMVRPGGKFLYRFQVTRPGIYWYHPHHHSSTNQVHKGLYGMILVTDPDEGALIASGTLPPLSQTFPLALSDMTICKAPGSNDAQTYATGPNVPWSGPGGALAAVQPSPYPVTLCETAPKDEDGDPRAPFAAQDVPNIQTAPTAGRTNEGQTVLTNGRNVGARQGSPAAPGFPAINAERLVVKAGQGVRLQLVNTAAVRFMRLRLTTDAGTLVPLVRVGGESGLLNDAVIEGGVPGGFDTKYGAGEILLPPGARADVVAAIPTNAVNTLTMWTQDFSRTGQGFSNIPTVPVMHMLVSGSQAPAYTISAGTDLRSATGHPVEILPAATGSLLAPAGFAPVAKPGLPNQDVQLTGNGASLGVNGTLGTHDVDGDYRAADHLGSTRYAKEGDVLELTVTNMTGAHHPFHLHGFSIQPISLTRPANPTYTWPYKEFRDNVDVPANYTLRFRVRLDARPQADGTTAGGAAGRWVFHCHIFFHATNGMLSELVVVSPTGNERPNVNSDVTDVTVPQGTTAQATGTFDDPDGNAVTLTSSRGTVVPGAGGKWSWSSPTGADPGGPVFVTATDTGSRRSQTVFTLDVTNVPPTIAVPGAQTVEQGSALAFPVGGTDVDPLTLTAAGLPAGLTFTDAGDRTGAVAGTVTAPPGTYTASFAASDAKAPAVSAQVPITVIPRVTANALVDQPERLVKGAITVGCTATGALLSSCRADVHSASSSVGTATRTPAAAGASVFAVVPLSKTFRAAVAKSLGGRTVTVRLDATPAGRAALPLTATTRVVPARISVSTPAFARRSAVVSAKGKTSLRALSKSVKRAKTITCTGRPDAGQSRRRGTALAKRRAAAACAVLRKAGLKARFRTVAATRPTGGRIVVTVDR